MIKPIEEAEEAAKRLMQEAYQRGSSDNITCVVVRFLTHVSASSHSSSVRSENTRAEHLLSCSLWPDQNMEFN